MDAFIGAVVGALLSAPLAFFFGLERSRYERFEERRALVIAELSGLVFEVQNNFYHWANVSLHAGTNERVEEAQVEKGHAAVESNNALVRSFRSNVLWLPPQTARQVQHFVETTKQLADAYGPHLGDIRHQMSPEGRQTANRMRHDLAELERGLVREFQRVVYPTPWRQKMFPYKIRFKSSQQ